MFYIVSTLVGVFLAYQILQLRSAKKHDEHLFRLCELRRATIKIMFDQRDSLSRNDYIALRKLVGALSLTINNYRNHKTVIFNFRRFMAHVRELKSLDNKTRVITTKNKEINDLKNRFNRALCLAFLAYTPFLRSEILAKLIVGVLNAFVEMGAKSLSVYVKEYKSALKFTDDLRKPPSLHSQ